MAQIQVNSWSKLSDNGGYNAAPVNIGINTEDIIGVETRKVPYSTTGITNIYYNYKVNNVSATILLVVTNAIGDLSTGLVTVDSYTGFDGYNNTISSTILLNPDFIAYVSTKTPPYNTDGIVNIIYNHPENSGYEATTFVVKQTLLELTTTNNGGNTVTVANITDASSLGKSLLLASTQAAAITALGAVDTTTSQTIGGLKTFTDNPTIKGTFPALQFMSSSNANLGFINFGDGVAAVPAFISTTVSEQLRLTVGNAAAATLTLGANGQIGLGNPVAFGNSGQVLTSGGASGSPSWTTPTAAVTAANPTATTGLTAVDGVATTFMRSDASPALNQAISPTWTGDHAFTKVVSGVTATASGHFPIKSQLDAAIAGIAGGLVYQGSWNAATNTPALVDGSGTNGFMYKVSVGGTRDLGSGSIVFAVGDHVVYVAGTDNAWENFGASESVASVNGHTGVVVLTPSDIGLAAANPTVTVGLTAKDGVATTYMRSDAAPAIDVTITPTWSGAHTFSQTMTTGAITASGVISSSSGVAGNTTVTAGIGSNSVQMSGAPNGQDPVIHALGVTDANVSIHFQAKGSGLLKLASPTNVTGAFNATGAATFGGGVNVAGQLGSANTTAIPSPTNSGITIGGAPTWAMASFYDQANSANNRTADLLFISNSFKLRFANDARNAFLDVLSINGGQGTGVTSITSTSGSGAWVHTGGIQVQSTTQGFLPPKMTTTQKNAIASPAEGLVVYDTTLRKLCVNETGVAVSGWKTVTTA